MNINTVYFKSATNMEEVNNSSIDLIITSPPYFNIKDYFKDGYQNNNHSNKLHEDIGALNNYNSYLESLLEIWTECERVLKPNGKLIINVPLMPMLKKNLNTHYNRHIFDLQSDIQHSILNNTGLFLMDLYIWNRTNSTKRLMFGSYPYPRNFYAQNTIEFITVYVKDGRSPDRISKEIKENSKLSKSEWIEFTKQIWDLPIPNKKDKAFGVHPAIMPEEIVRRCIRLYSFEGDLILDPFTGSGTTLKVAKELKRNYIGYELYKHYKPIILEKTGEIDE